MSWEPSDYGIALAALVAAAAAIWAGRRAFRLLRTNLQLLRALRRGHSWAVERMPLNGHVGLRGTAAAIDSIESPHSGRAAIYLRVVEEVWDNTPNVVGAAGKWICSNRDEEAAPFEVTDGDQAVLVDPTGAEVLAPSQGGPSPPNPGYRFTESLIAPGDPVVVLGQLTEQSGFTQDGVYRGSPFRRVLADGPRGLLIASPPLLRRRLALGLSLGGGGLLAALTGLVLALLVAAQALAVARVELPAAAQVSWPPPPAYGGEHWLGSRAGAEAAGPGAAEVWVLGWITGGRPERVLRRTLRRELWQRKLNALTWQRVTHRRAWLLFEVLRVEGTVFRRPAFWKAFCKLRPTHCN